MNTSFLLISETPHVDRKKIYTLPNQEKWSIKECNSSGFCSEWCLVLWQGLIERGILIQKETKHPSLGERNRAMSFLCALKKKRSLFSQVECVIVK